MTYTIPLDVKLYAYSEYIRLSNKSYLFEFKWNTRFKYWTVSVYTTQREPLLQCVKLVFGINVVEQFVDKGIPLGGFFLYGGDSEKIKEGELGTTIELIYIEEGSDVPV